MVFLHIVEFFEFQLNNIFYAIAQSNGTIKNEHKSGFRIQETVKDNKTK